MGISCCWSAKSAKSAKQAKSQIAMAIVFLSLMVILSSVEGYRQPFTAFRSHQADIVHGSRYHGLGRVVSKPVVSHVQRVASRPRFTHQTSVNTRFQPVSQQLDSNRGFLRNSFNFPQTNVFRGSTNIRGRVPANKFTTGSIVQQAKSQAESTLSILKSFEDSDVAAQYIDPLFETSECLNNLEDVTKLIEEGTKLIVDDGSEIIYLEAIVDNLKDEKDINKLIKSSSKMLRTLDGLIPALSSPSSNLCISTPEASVKAFKDLGHALGDISNNRNLNEPQRSRQILQFSSEGMDQTADFLETLNTSLKTFETICQEGSQNQVAIFNSIRDIMDSLADLFEVMGFDDKSAEIKKQGEFIEKIVEVFDDLKDLDTTLECGFGGSYLSLAQILDDLAEIVSSVGIEKLSEELGIDLDFVNSV